MFLKKLICMHFQWHGCHPEFFTKVWQRGERLKKRPRDISAKTWRGTFELLSLCKSENNGLGTWRWNHSENRKFGEDFLAFSLNYFLSWTTYSQTWCPRRVSRQIKGGQIFELVLFKFKWAAFRKESDIRALWLHSLQQTHSCSSALMFNVKRIKLNVKNFLGQISHK